MTDEKVDPKKVKELADKARKDPSLKSVPSTSDINDVWYGPQTENQQAAGAGEFNT